MRKPLKRWFICLTKNESGMIFPWVLMVTLVFVLLVSFTAASFENHQRLTQSHQYGITKKHLLERARHYINTELTLAQDSEAVFPYSYRTANGTAAADCRKETETLWKCSWELSVNESGSKYVVTFQYPDK